MSKKSNKNETRSRFVTYPGELVRVPPTMDVAETQAVGAEIDAEVEARLAKKPYGEMQRAGKAELCVWDEKTGRFTDVGLHEEILSGISPEDEAKMVAESRKRAIARGMPMDAVDLLFPKKSDPS